MEETGNESLYIDIKRQICDWIYQGIYLEGDRIPSERILAEQFQVSRVTIRKSMELLEKERLVIREIGSGTRICYHNFGAATGMDMITLVAPAKSPFFSEFIQYFQGHADEHNTLLLYVEKPEHEKLENCLYRLYQKDLRNIVVWPDDMEVDMTGLRRLRALGMNLVFFDTDTALPFADCVHLDNGAGIHKLYQVKSKGKKRNSQYVGWDRMDIFSVREREEAYRRLKAGNSIIRLPWKREGELEAVLKDILKRQRKEDNLADTFFCGSGEIGIAIARVLKGLKIFPVDVATIDEFPASQSYHITTYGQDFAEIARVIYRCFQNQNQKQEKWKAKNYKIKGILTKR